MTATTPEATTLQEVADANAAWIGGKVTDGDAEALQFLRYRPVRELADVQDAAKRARAADVVAVLENALRLARGHSGGPSTCPLGYAPLEYPVTGEETVRLLQQAADATRMLRLPGADRGWSWSSSVDVDPDAVEVVVRLRARHPRLEQEPAQQ